MTTPTTPPVGAPQSARGSGGSIYDLGYQGYSGPRLGRRSAVLALFTQTFRSAFGIGRGGRAKIAPFTLGRACHPAGRPGGRASPRWRRRPAAAGS